MISIIEPEPGLQKVVDASGSVHALAILPEFKSETVRFFTPESFSMQAGFLYHSKDSKVRLHRHNKTERTIENTSEALFIRKGRARLIMADIDSSISIGLEVGAAVILFDGAHGLFFFEDTEIIEIKQGPYAGARDKEFLE